MFVVSRKTQPISSLDNAVMHDLEKWSHGKPGVQWYGSSEPSSPRYSQAKADDDPLRRKLRESLTSALEMVVSKKLLKTVLGKPVAVEVVEVTPRWKTEPKRNVGRRTDDDAAVKLSDGDVQTVDDSSGSDKFVKILTGGGFDAKVSDTQGRLFLVSTAKLSDRCDSQCEGDEATVELAEEAKGGIQLMEQARKVAWNVELNLFSLNGGVNKKYKEKARSLLFNLKDKSNPELRNRVLKGEVNPEILVRMCAAELASKEHCQWRIAKAEEFASMVVLTEADTDPRRILKKTHIGEFQVVVDDTGVAALAESKALRSAFPANGRGGKGGDDFCARIDKGDSLREFPNKFSVENCEVDRQALREIHLSHETAENGSPEMEEPADSLANNLSAMNSPDEGTEWRRESETKGPSHRNGSVQDREMKIVFALHPESSREEMHTYVLPGLSDCGTSKLCKSASTSFSDPESSIGVCISKSSEGHTVSSVWEGSLQLSATRSVFIGGFHKSGVRLELKDWPQSVEVKGRVRLGVLNKFLRDLQLSRSRTMTVLSLCPLDGQGDDKRVGAYLKEIADHYRMGDRAGFAEPKPGFELYLLAPGSACLDQLVEEQKTTNVAHKTEDEVLVGVVVWRKVSSQVQSFSRGPKQSCNVKKVASSNLLSDSSTTGNAQPLHGKETVSSRGHFCTSLNNASGDTPMHSTQSLRSSSDTWDPQLPRDYEHVFPVPIGLRNPCLIAPLKNAHCAMTDSCLLPQCSLDQEDLPPGFIFRTKPPVPRGRPAVLQTDQHVQDSRGSPSDAGGVPGSLVRDENNQVSTKSPPGFWPKAPAKFPARTIQKIQGVFQQDDDDLPEFNFDTDGEAQRNPTYQMTSAGNTVFLADHDRNVLPKLVTALQHVNDASNRYEVHQDVGIYQPSSTDLQSMHNRLFSSHTYGKEMSSASQSVSLFPSKESWNNEVFARETVERVPQQAMFGSIIPGRNHINSPRVTTEDLARREKLRENSHYASGHSSTMPSTFKASTATIFHGASHTAVSNGFLPRNFQSPVITRLGWPSLPPTLSSQHNSEQPPLLNMFSQHQQKELKNSVLSSAGGMPLPYQELRRHELEAVGPNYPSELSESNSTQMYSRFKRKMEQKERYLKVRASESTDTDQREGRAEARPREFCWESSLGSTVDVRQKRWRR